MDEEREMLVKYLAKFIEKMNRRGDAEWEEVGNELGYSRSLSMKIQSELRRRHWLKEVAWDIRSITKSGLLEAKFAGILTESEYGEKLKDIFDE